MTASLSTRTASLHAQSPADHGVDRRGDGSGDSEFENFDPTFGLGMLPAAMLRSRSSRAARRGPLPRPRVTTRPTARPQPAAEAQPEAPTAPSKPAFERGFEAARAGLSLGDFEGVDFEFMRGYLRARAAMRQRAA